MKRILFTLVGAIFFASQTFFPVMATPYFSEPCGDSYIVQNHDTLLKIATLCGTTVDNILALNPQIGNANLIFVGQELRVKGKVYPVVRVIKKVTVPTTYTVQTGDTFLKIASMFEVTIWEIIQANPGFHFFTRLIAGMEVNIPASTKVTSYTVYNTTLEVYLNPRVTVSAALAEPGDDIHVYVSGFPPGAWIDYQIGVTGQPYTYLFDGTISDEGTANLTFEIPSGANHNDLWVVHVATTSHKNGVKATSPLIRINNPNTEE